MTEPTNDPTMDCEAAIRRLWDYLDGELDAAVHAAVHAHVTLCASCRGFADFERVFLSALRAAPIAAGADTALRRRVVAALAAAGLPGAGLPGAVRPGGAA